MSNPTSDNNFENQCFNPFEKNSVLLDNLSDPDFNFFNDNNLRMIDTYAIFLRYDINTKLITSGFIPGNVGRMDAIVRCGRCLAGGR